LNALATAHIRKKRTANGFSCCATDGCYQHKKWKGFAKVSEVEPVWNGQF
jgi:hypothetical protein